MEMEKKTKNTRKGLGLRGQLILKIGIVVAVLLFAFFLIALKLQKNNLESSLDKTYEARSTCLMNKIEKMASEDSGYLHTTVAAFAAAGVEDGGEVLAANLAYITEIDENICMAYIGLDDSSLYNGSGWIPDEDFDCTTRGWYKQAAEAGGEIVFTDPYVDANTGDVLITTAMYFTFGEYSGVAALDLSISSMFGNLTEETRTFGEEDDYAFIIAKDESLVYHPNEDFKSTADATSYLSDILGGAYQKALEEDSAIEDYNGESVYLTAAKSDMTGWTVVLVSPTYHYDGLVQKAKDNLFFVFAAFALITILAIYIVGTMITSKMKKASKELNEVIGEIQSGNGDLTRQIEVNDRTEIGQIVDGVNALIVTLGSIISGINDATLSLVDDVTNLKNSAKSTSDNITNISGTMEEMSAGTEETSASTSVVSKQVDDINVMTQNVSRNAQEKANHLADKLERIIEVTENTREEDKRIIERLKKEIDNLNEKIAATKKVEEIQQMTEGISNVASETNLLSLNASIEAARAGEAGRGFAVVAGEIGSLANESSEMAENIRQVSDEVLAIVDDLVRAAEQVSQVMLEISEQNTKNTEHILTSYNEEVREDLAAMREIAESSNEMAEALMKIHEAMSSIDASVEENALGISSVANGAAELIQISDEVMERAGSVGAVSEQLKAEVEKFRF